MNTEIQARDIMQTDVITVSPEMSLGEVRDIFVRNRISGAPVVDEDGLCGVISQADIVRVAMNKDFDDFPESSFFLGFPAFYTGELSSGLSEGLDERYVEEAMTEHVFSVTPEERVSVIAVMMRQHRIHRVIVVEDRKVVGILTALDLIQILENH